MGHDISYRPIAQSTAQDQKTLQRGSLAVDDGGGGRNAARAFSCTKSSSSLSPSDRRGGYRLLQPSPELSRSPEPRKTKSRTGKTRRNAHTRETGFWCGQRTTAFSVFLAIYRIKNMQAMLATTRAPRATLHRELRHPPAQNVPRDSLKPTDSVRTARTSSPFTGRAQLTRAQTNRKKRKANSILARTCQTYSTISP